MFNLLRRKVERRPVKRAFISLVVVLLIIVMTTAVLWSKKDTQLASVGSSPTSPPVAQLPAQEVSPEAGSSRNLMTPHKVSVEAVDLPTRKPERRLPEVNVQRGATVKFSIRVQPDWDVAAALLEIQQPLPEGISIVIPPPGDLTNLKRLQEYIYSFSLQIGEGVPDGRYIVALAFIQKSGGGSPGAIMLIVGNPPPERLYQVTDGAVLIPAETIVK